MNFHKSLVLLHEAILSGTSSQASSYIKGNEFLSAEARLQIYIESYRMRLAQALQADFPCFIHLAGDDAQVLIESYIEATPPNHYSLDQYHIRFANFVKSLGRPRYIWEMAMLESAIAEVFWLPNSEALTVEDLKTVTPQQFGGLTLTLRKAARLLELEYDCESYLQKFRSGKKPKTKPSRKANYLLVYRDERTVMRHVLSAGEYRILAPLSTGKTVGETISQIMAEKAICHQEIAKGVQTWFTTWVKAGFFQKTN